ncbi:hypothetical protein [Microvirga puerhi]|uniref:Uncharacterized protein n=1 Tax=Microvirga puerhi TaxID=2876078 RepID=A0ABS7VMT5_9HYPH|nr:hypothetical protein [Microvirga puerhi]MBZ6076327.1 hypothetical protein [Microvirga puerhi]
MPWPQFKAVLNTLKLAVIATLTLGIVVVVSLLIALMQFQIRLSEAQNRSPDFSLSQVIHLANVERGIEKDLGSFQSGSVLNDDSISVRRIVETYRIKISDRSNYICEYVLRHGTRTNVSRVTGAPAPKAETEGGDATGAVTAAVALSAQASDREAAERCAKNIFDSVDVDLISVAHSTQPKVVALSNPNFMEPAALLDAMTIELSPEYQGWFDLELRKIRDDAKRLFDFLYEPKTASAFQVVLRACDRLKDMANAVQIASSVQFDALAIIQFYSSQNCGAVISLGSPAPNAQKSVDRNLMSELISYYRFYSFLFGSLLMPDHAQASTPVATGQIASASLDGGAVLSDAVIRENASFNDVHTSRQQGLIDIVFAPLDFTYAVLVVFSGILGALLRYVWEVATRWGIYRTAAANAADRAAGQPQRLSRMNIQIQEVLVRILLAIMCALTIYVLARISLVALGDRTALAGGLQLNPFLVAFLAVISGIMTDETFGLIRRRAESILDNVGSDISAVRRKEEVVIERETPNSAKTPNAKTEGSRKRGEAKTETKADPAPPRAHEGNGEGQ